MSNMTHSIRIILGGLAASSLAFASAITVPEINMTSAAGAISLIGGAALVLRSRRKKS
ncbi:MAG: LPXTG cell wall anchor domain-containing protein [Acidobacteria bacterium]|nr:LPXTG cell wall anchor domain-containing protein [Acidobacteriota bacterium]